MQKKKKVLSELYNGNITPQSRPIENGSKYQELQIKMAELADTLEKKLSDEEKKLLDEIISTWGSISEANGEECFTLGFRLGAKMILEIFETDDELLDLK
ncbi:DUF6809 family protein [Anaerotignum sp.]|uniref:DUF6809 family protein n=1 Tax=Anaerotignum sp. TaxID=2039241 RepID=UPI0028A726C0|nr:DUF6809 family protein [Anaerotignum sp.]